MFQDEYTTPLCVSFTLLGWMKISVQTIIQTTLKKKSFKKLYIKIETASATGELVLAVQKGGKGFYLCHKNVISCENVPPIFFIELVSMNLKYINKQL